MGTASFHLIVPATAQGLHRLADPEVAGRQAARERLQEALVVLSAAAGRPVTGQAGDHPLDAIADALNLGHYDEIILSTLPWRLSRWLRLDLPSKVRALGVPVLPCLQLAGRRAPRSAGRCGMTA